MFRRIFSSLLIFSLSLPLYAGEGFVVESVGSGRNIDSRKRLIERVLATDTMHFGYSALSIILDSRQKEPRGKMQGRSITLSASVLSDSEFIQLFTHELGHYIDIYSIVADSKGSDPSDIFYRVSWSDKTTKNAGESLASFVSGYAATNKYEDLAESFTFYVFHNADFAERAQKNESLRQKYLFFSEYVFPDGEFSGTDFRTGTIPSYLWDTTKVPISLKKYLYSLR